MRRLVFLILALATLLPSLAEAYDVLILQSRRDPAYEEVVKGFRSGQSVSQRLIVLTDYAEVDVIRIVREDHPRMILAVGDAALTATRSILNLPVVAVMALGIHTGKYFQSNLTGVSMFVQPQQYVSMCKSMNIRRVGVIYNAEKSGWYLQQARKAASDAGVELVTREIYAPRETVAQLSTLAGKVDALWMLPDSTAVTRETAEAYFRFGQQHSVPVISFSASYLGLGAAAVLEIDHVAMGQQVFDMTAKLLKIDNSGNSDKIRFHFPLKVTSKFNPAVIKNLGLSPQ